MGPVHTVYHFSPLLGAVMLANCVDNGIFEEPLHKLFRNNPENPRTHLPELAIGSLPTLIGIPEVKRRLETSPLFKQLRQHVR